MTVDQRMSLRELGGVADDARELGRGEVALARAKISRSRHRRRRIAQEIMDRPFPVGQ